MLDILPADILYELSRRISRGAWKPFIFTCKAFLAYNINDIILARANPLLTLLTKFPDVDWTWYDLGKNPNISLQWIVDHPHLPWNWSGISYNRDITLRWLLDNLDNNWQWSGLSTNDSITIEDVIITSELALVFDLSKTRSNLSNST
jgi:hypothetical protein